MADDGAPRSAALATRSGTPARAEIAAIFERHGMTILGPPLSAD